MNRSVLCIMESKIAQGAARIVLAVIFVLAGATKILHPNEFADAVAAFRMLPIQTVNIFAIVLPWIEIVCGVSILLRPTLTAAATTMLFLNASFMVAAASAMARGLDIQCGCFTISGAHQAVGWGLLLRDVVFIILCVIVLREAKAYPMHADRYPK